MVLFFSVWPRAFGRRDLGRIQGAAQALTVLASAVGPLLLAWCVDLDRELRRDVPAAGRGHRVRRRHRARRRASCRAGRHRDCAVRVVVTTRRGRALRHYLAGGDRLRRRPGGTADCGSDWTRSRVGLAGVVPRRARWRDPRRARVRHSLRLESRTGTPRDRRSNGRRLRSSLGRRPLHQLRVSRRLAGRRRVVAARSFRISLAARRSSRLRFRAFSLIVLVNAAVVFAAPSRRIMGTMLIAALIWTWRPISR